MPHRAYIGIGSNLGKKKENYLEARQRIAKIPTTRVVKESSLYETEPWSGETREWFVNGVIEIETELGPEELLRKLKNIERAMGRKRVRKRWGARVIDLDILLYDSAILEKKNLKIPHPEMHKRKFVLVPLSEIAPQVVHPILGATTSELMATVKDNKKVSLLRS